MKEEIDQNIPVELGSKAFLSNDLFFQQNFDVADDSNISDKPYYMDGTMKDSTIYQSVTPNVLDKDMRKEFGSTGAYDEYTATQETDAKEQEDYGQKLANMNVEGMPWFQEEIDEEEMIARRSVPELNARETRSMIFSSMFAALLVGGVFILGFFLFIMFCLKVWF